MQLNATKGNENLRTCNIPVMPIANIEDPTKVINPNKIEEQIEVIPTHFRIVLASDNYNEDLDLMLNACYVDHEQKEDMDVDIAAENKKFKNNDLKAEYKGFDSGDSYIKVISHIDYRWFRIRVKITNPALADPEAFELDNQFKNKLQDANAKVMIFNESKLLHVIYAPSYVTNTYYWDVGLLNMGQRKFIKINACYDIPITRKLFSKHYLNLFKYLNEQPMDFDLRHKFGFDSEECVLKMDDHILTDNTSFISAIKKLPIHWISDNLKEDMIKERENELNNFILYLANCTKNIFGELSLKRLVSVFGPNLGVHQSTPLKAHRTLTRSTRKMIF